MVLGLRNDLQVPGTSVSVTRTFPPRLEIAGRLAGP
jgi:hypothetical protein